MHQFCLINNPIYNFPYKILIDINRSKNFLTINYSATDACALGLSTIIQDYVWGI